LHVYVDNPRLVHDLQFFLRRVGCATIQVHWHELEVEVPGAPSEEQARREVELYLALWAGRKADVGVYVLGPESVRGSGSRPGQFDDD
jgi:hypothetical protein